MISLWCEGFFFPIESMRMQCLKNSRKKRVYAGKPRVQISILRKKLAKLNKFIRMAGQYEPNLPSSYSQLENIFFQLQNLINLMPNKIFKLIETHGR